MIDFAEQPGGPPQSTEIKARLDGALTNLVQTITEAKNKWLSDVAKKHLPDFVIAWAESGNPALKARAAKWTAKKQYELQEHPDGRCRFVKGEKVLSEFRTVIECGKVRFEKKDFE